MLHLATKVPSINFGTECAGVIFRGLEHERLDSKDLL